MILSLLCRPWTDRMKIHGPYRHSALRAPPTVSVEAPAPPGCPWTQALLPVCVVCGQFPTHTPQPPLTMSSTRSRAARIVSRQTRGAKSVNQGSVEISGMLCGDQTSQAPPSPPPSDLTHLLSPPGHHSEFSRLPLLSLLQTEARGGKAGSLP